MAIHPRYADAILDGRKRVEFRKRPIARDVSTVVIYATSPMKKIIGEFSVTDVVVEQPEELWDSMNAIGGINEHDFNAYYRGAQSGAGILLQNPRRYPAPVSLAQLEPKPSVPQSFSYLPEQTLEHVRQLGEATRRSDTSRIRT